MLTTTLAIRALLALLLSAASFTAVLNGPATTASAYAPAARQAQAWNTVQTSARRAVADDLAAAYAINDARDSRGAATPLAIQTSLRLASTDSPTLACR